MLGNKQSKRAAEKGLQEPVAFDLQANWNAAGDSVTQVNIFFTERLGKVKFYDGVPQLPPHIDNHFFHLTFAGNNMWVNTVDTATGKITRTMQVGRHPGGNHSNESAGIR